MVNSKGQVLVAFMLTLPVLIILMGLIYDFGTIGLEKRKAASNIKEAIEYGLENIDNDNIEQKVDILITNNIKGIVSKTISFNNEEIKIEITIKVDGNFKRLFDSNLYKVKLKYRGYIDDGLIKIEG